MMQWLIRLAAIAALASAIYGIGLATESKAEKFYELPAFAGPLFDGVNRRDFHEEDPHDVARTVRVLIPAGLDPNKVMPEDPAVTAKLVASTPQLENESHPQDRSVVFLLDNSLSMVIATVGVDRVAPAVPASDPTYQRVEETKRLMKLLRPTDRVAVGCFPPLKDPINPGFSAAQAQILRDFTTPTEAAGALEQLRGREGASTPLYRAMIQGANMLLHEPEDRARILVVLTDGGDTDLTMPASTAVAAMQGMPIHVFVIALGQEPDVKTLSKMSENVVRVDQAKGLNLAFEQLAQRIEHISSGSEATFTVQGGNTGSVIFVDKSGNWRGLGK